MMSMFGVWKRCAHAAVLMACLGGICAAGEEAADAKDGKDEVPVAKRIAEHLKRLGESYYDVPGNYPEHYTCKMKSNELVENMKERDRKIWGKGYVRVTKDEKGLRMTAENLAKPEAAPLFNLGLGLWQIKVGLELKALEQRMPSFFAACALAAVFGSEHFEKQQKDTYFFGLKAKNENARIQEVSFRVTDEYELKRIYVRDKLGGVMDARFKSKRNDFTDDKWVVTAIAAKLKDPDGTVRIWHADLDYAKADDHVAYGKLAFKLTDEKGKLIRDEKHKVNPVAFRFGDYEVTKPSAGPQEHSFDDMGAWYDK